MDEPKILVTSKSLPPGQHWADTAPRSLTSETHVLQTLRAPLDLPFRDFLALFLWDEDLGMRFQRASDDCEIGADVEILHRREDEFEISVGVRRDRAERARYPRSEVLNMLTVVYGYAGRQDARQQAEHMLEAYDVEMAAERT